MNYITEPGRIYILGKNNELPAEVTFPETEAGTAEISHTFVDPFLRGQGIAGELIKRALQEIKEAGLKPKPACSYAQAWFRKHPEEL